MAKTSKQIQDEADRLFGKGASDEKFKWRQEQQRAAGLDVEKRKRGGVAGGYDRNKKLVGAAVTAAGYMLGGPTGAAVSRGFMQGVDRPGKSGIGFDVSRAAKGALEGYSAGKVADIGRAGVGKLKGMFSPDKVPVSGNVPGPAQGETMVTADYGRQIGTEGTKRSMSEMLGGAKDTVGDAAKSLGSGALKFAKENPAIVANAATAGAGVIGSKLEADAANRRYDLEEEMFREEQARRNRLAQLLMPLFQQQVQQYGAQRQG